MTDGTSQTKRRATQLAYWHRVAEQRNAERRVAYTLHREAILERQRARAVCDVCHANVVKRYLRRHCLRKHTNKALMERWDRDIGKTYSSKTTQLQTDVYHNACQII